MHKKTKYTDIKLSIFIVVSILFASFFTYCLSSCSSSSSTFRRSSNDTAIVAALYLKDYSGNVFAGIARQIKFDAQTKVSIDSSTDKKTWIRDTAYYFLVFDTVFTKEHKDSIDKLGRVVLQPDFRLQIPKQYVSLTTIKLP